MAGQTLSPFKVEKNPSRMVSKGLPVNTRIDPPSSSIQHSSSPTKRSFSSPTRRFARPGPSQPPLSPQKRRKRPLNKLTPDILWTYVQWGFNLVMGLVGLMILFRIISVVRYDVRDRVEKQSSAVIFEIEECARNYMRNKCMPGQRAPALNELCSHWEKCMHQDPQSILHSQLFAEAFTDALSSFLAPMSWKTIAFLTLVFIGTPLFVNFLGPKRTNYTRWYHQISH